MNKQRITHSHTARTVKSKKMNILIVLRGGLGGFVLYRSMFLNLLNSCKEMNFYFFLPEERKIFFEDKVPPGRLFSYTFTVKNRYVLNELLNDFRKRYPVLFAKKYFLGICQGGEFLNICHKGKEFRQTLPRLLVRAFCPVFFDLGTHSFNTVSGRTEQKDRAEIAGIDRSICTNPERKKIYSRILNTLRPGPPGICNFELSRFQIHKGLINLIRKIKKNSRLIAINPFTSDILRDYPLEKCMRLKTLLKKAGYKVILIGRTGDLVSPEYHLIQKNNFIPLIRNKQLRHLVNRVKSLLPEKSGRLTLRYFIIKYAGFVRLLPPEFNAVYTDQRHYYSLTLKPRSRVPEFHQSRNFDITYHDHKLSLRDQIPVPLDRAEHKLLPILIGHIINADKTDLSGLFKKDLIGKEHPAEDGAALNLINRLSLKEYIALINDLDLLITGDTSGMHFAALGNIKSVRLFLPNYLHKKQYPRSDSFPFKMTDPAFADENALIAKKNDISTIRPADIMAKVDRILNAQP